METKKVPYRGFVGGGYLLQSVKADCQRCINYYPERNEMGTEQDNNQFILMPTPGLGNPILNLSPGPGRGLYTTTGGNLVAASGNKLYRIDYTNGVWSSFNFGTMFTNVGPVSMADNGTQIMIADGRFGYILNLVTGVFSQITDPAFPGAAWVTQMDGYFIGTKPKSGQFFNSALWNGLDYNIIDGAGFYQAQSNPNALSITLFANGLLWVFTQTSIEVWYDTGTTPITLQKIQGVQIEYGTKSPGTVQILDNSPIWLGFSKSGGTSVWKMKGYTPVRVSNHAVDEAIQAQGDLTGAIAWSYQRNGHTFYCLNLSLNCSTTWVLDLTTGMWSERAYTNPSTGLLERHRVQYATAAGSGVFGLDYANGNLYLLSENVCTDNGAVVTRLRTAPHISSRMNRIIHNGLELDMESGSGLDGNVQGSNPIMMLRYSDDGGHTWSNEITRPIGKIGAFLSQVRWNQLGMSRNRVYEIKLTDPIWAPIIGANIWATPGKN